MNFSLIKYILLLWLECLFLSVLVRSLTLFTIPSWGYLWWGSLLASSILLIRLDYAKIIAMYYHFKIYENVILHTPYLDGYFTQALRSFTRFSFTSGRASSPSSFYPCVSTDPDIDRTICISELCNKLSFVPELLIWITNSRYS